MRAHLKSKHTILYEERDSQKARERKPSPTRMTIDDDAEPSTSCISKHDDIDEQPLAKKKRLVQTSMKSSCVTKYHADHPRKRKIDNLITEMVCMDMQPFSVVEDRGFNNLVAELEPRYSMLSRRQLTRKCLPDLYKKHFGEVQNQLDQAEFVALTTDDWTSRAGRGYMSLTAHFVDSKWDLQSKVISVSRITESQTGEHIAKELEESMKTWNIDKKVVAVVTDGAKNMMKAGRLLTDVDHVYCFAHNLNLAVKDTLENLPSLEKARAKVRRIVSHFHHTHKATRELEEYQAQEIKERKKEVSKPQNQLTHQKETTAQKPDDKDKSQRPKKLIQEVVTRWNSTYLMLQRFLQLQAHVRRVLTDNWKTELLLTKTEIETIQDAVAALKPFDDATVEMSAEKSTSMSKKIPIINGLRHTLEEYNKEKSSAVAKKLIMYLDERFPDLESSAVSASATLLDPRFMKLAFSSEEDAEMAVEMIKSKLPKTKPVEPAKEKEKTKKTGYWAFFDEKVKKTQELSATPCSLSHSAEMDLYLKETPLDRDLNPLHWWAARQKVMPNLARIAKRYASIPATSTPSERLFSKAGELVSQRRATISDTHVDQVLFLNKNM